MRPAGWEDDGFRLTRETDHGYTMAVRTVRTVRTDVDEYSTEAEVSGHGTSHARVWVGDTSAACGDAAAWWCEGVAEVAEWHQEQGLPV